MKRNLYTSDHESYRTAVAEFVAREVEPNIERWEKERKIDRETWIAAGKQGIIGLSAPEEHGGAGMSADYRYRSVVIEELARVSANSLSSSFSLQDDIAMPYLSTLATDEQKSRWLPKMVSGEIIGAIAMTEPGTGSDLRGIKTTGKKVDGGWIVNGAKTFITNGIHSDIVITVARTDPEGGAHGFSLLVVERGMKGFSRGRQLEKIGLHAQDTAELFYDQVFVPDENLLGEVGGGFIQLMENLPVERLSIAVTAVASASTILDQTVDYVRQREAFGQRVADFQNTQFKLAELSTELDVTRAYVDAAVLALNEGTLSAVDAAKAKFWSTEMQNRLIDACLQMHGGYGYMLEYPVARAYQDARIQKIYGGTSEIMKKIIGRDLIGDAPR